MVRVTWVQVAVFSVVVVLVFVFGLLLVSGLWGGGFGMTWPDMMGGYNGDFPGGMMDGSMYGWPFGLLMCLLPMGFLTLLALGIVWLVRAKGRGDFDESETALEIVRTRYAKGEITKEEFDQMKADL